MPEPLGRPGQHQPPEVRSARVGVELGLQFHLDRVMAQPTTRDRIVEALKDLPEDATFQDAIERLVFLAKIDIGLAELDAGKGIPHNEVKRRFGV
jgi:predicted transcriptional regulator